MRQIFQIRKGRFSCSALLMSGLVFGLLVNRSDIFGGQWCVNVWLGPLVFMGMWRIEKSSAAAAQGGSPTANQERDGR
jgi:hypothetical protein